MSIELDIIERHEWKARAPKGRLSRIALPSRELYLHHSAGPEEGAAGVKSMQNFHMDSRDWTDVGYSVVVDRTLLEVFEGRGVGIRGAHSYPRNSVSHGICVMGNFEKVEASVLLVELLGKLVAYGHQQGWWPAAFTGGHKDLKRATLCPGGSLYPRIGEINAYAAELLTGGDDWQERYEDLRGSLDDVRSVLNGLLDD